MNNTQANNPQARQRQALTLRQYVQLRNGVPPGDSKSLRNMLHRSLSATSFAAFWQYWNPIWGYGLGKYVYAPAPVLQPAAAFILTFIVSGILHDLATMALSRAFAFLFTPWFFLLGVVAALGRAFGMDLGQRPFWQRASVNLAYLITCLILTLVAKKEFLI